MKKLLYIILLIVHCQLSIVQSQWVQQTVPVSKPITGIKFINANTGWACTEIGTGGLNYCYILYTNNGGTNWIVQDSVFNATFGALSVIDNNIIYCGGTDFTANNANLRKTTNGGLNWQTIPTPVNMGIEDMVFLNKDSGWTCIGIFSDVRTTTNGGVNWTVRTSGIAAQTQRLFFLNYNTGFCGANSNLYKTTNAGVNWSLLYNSPDGVFSVFFMNEITGWIGAANDKIYFTSNSGTNWQQQIVPPLAGTTTDICFLNSQTGWAGNRSIYIFKTTNGGINWGYQRDTSRSFRISILDNNNGWSGDVGISHTTNSGGNIIYLGINLISNQLPSSYKLFQNYPNPFNPMTKIKFDIVKSSQVSLIIYDILGKVLHNENEQLSAGSYEFKWDASEYSSGIYFYTLLSENYTETKKMLLVK